jgi:hypothetical protein
LERLRTLAPLTTEILLLQKSQFENWCPGEDSNL